MCAVNDVVILQRDVYAEAAAARLLGLSQATLHYWLEGGHQGGREYRPVLRPEPTGRKTVTWGEFVEAGLLKEYRAKRISLPSLRRFIDRLRLSFGVPYPLADRRPLVSEHGLVMQAQNEAGLPAELWLVLAVGDQGILSYEGRTFLQRVTWRGDTATQYRPSDDPHSPVRIDPLVRYGRPSVAGISTKALWEQNHAGVDLEDIAEAFDLELRDVMAAIAFEDIQATQAA